MRKFLVILSSGMAFVIFLFVAVWQETMNWIDREKAKEWERWKP